MEHITKSVKKHYNEILKKLFPNPNLQIFKLKLLQVNFRLNFHQMPFKWIWMFSCYFGRDVMPSQNVVHFVDNVVRFLLVRVEVLRFNIDRFFIIRLKVERSDVFPNARHADANTSVVKSKKFQKHFKSRNGKEGGSVK
jgi:hypothetical protein